VRGACWRLHTGARGSGNAQVLPASRVPLHYGCIDYSNGYMFATMRISEPGIQPGRLGGRKPRLVAPRSERSRFGPLTCVDVVSDQTLCLLRNGWLTVSSVRFGRHRLPLDQARLLSHQPAAPIVTSAFPGPERAILLRWRGRHLLRRSSGCARPSDGRPQPDRLAMVPTHVLGHALCYSYGACAVRPHRGSAMTLMCCSECASSSTLLHHQGKLKTLHR